jgi:hypothetical protein
MPGRDKLPIASDSLETSVVASKRNVEPDNTLACLDEVKILLGNAGLGGSLSVEKLDLLEETGLTMLIETGTVFVSRGGRREAGLYLSKMINGRVVNLRERWRI